MFNAFCESGTLFFLKKKRIHSPRNESYPQSCHFKVTGTVSK
jgi:hypothetical protein